jgi:hypothetical protein
MWFIFLAHGDAKKLDLVLLDYAMAELQQRSREATLWRASAADPLFLPPLMVEGRLLQPSSSATASLGRRFKVIFNLQATMPRRHCCSGVACSRCTTPSGLVPDGDVFGHDVKLSNGGEGARLDRFTKNLIRVLCANCKDRSVNYNSTLKDNECFQVHCDLPLFKRK